MPALLLQNDILSLPAEAADRLLSVGNGDAALLYLGLLRHREVEPARRALGWTDQRAAAAFQELVRHTLAQGSVQAVAQPEETELPPSYRRADLMACLSNDTNFSALYQEVMKALGRPLSDADLQSLYLIYDYLALPAEVIFLLTKWCTSQCEHKYGPGRVPRMPMIKKEAFRWKRLGIDTLSSAESYIARQQAVQSREAQLMPLLGLGERSPVEKERQYIAGWVDMGFDDETIHLAYERTLFQKGSMNWSYLNAILKRWHAAGLHTVDQVKKVDKYSPPPQPNRKGRPSQKNYQPTQTRIEKNANWLDDFLARQRPQEKER